MKKTALIIGAFLATLAAGPWGLILLAAALLVTAVPAHYVLGVSYPEINTTTLATTAANTPLVQEQLWTMQVVLSANPTLDETPFADNMTGRVINGKQSNQSQLKKALVEIIDTTKVRGQTINVPTMAGVGGEGASGEQTRLGTEAPLIPGNFQVTIGNQFYSVGLTQVLIDRSVIGGEWNKAVNEGLRARHNKKKSDSTIYAMLNVAHNFTGSITGGSQNLLFPNGVTGRDGLHSANVLDTPFIAAAGDYLPGIGASCMDTVTDSGGSVGELFMLLATDRSLVNLESEPALLEAFKFAEERGKENPLFKGGFAKWKGHGIYRWKQKDHANAYAIGSPLCPRARLGAAFAAGGTGAIKGGGFAGNALATSSGTLPTFEATVQWFQYFSNSAWNSYGGVAGQSWNASTGTTRYVAIINPNGAAYYYYQYTVNAGNTITVSPYTPSGQANAGNATGNHPIGSLIVEVNALGTPFNDSIMFGCQAVAAGMGRIDGSPVAPEVGKRTVEKLDHGKDISVGVEAVWGCAPVQRAGDNLYPGFVVLEHAIYVPGLPTT